jgi:hypothetical protein
MNKLLASKRRQPSGDTKTWRLQELSFVHIELMRMGRAKQTATRKELSFTVAACYSNKGWVAQRTRSHERLWIRHRIIPSRRQGVHSKTQCLLEDAGTLIAVQEYMTGAGKLASQAGLAKAVTDYWSSLDRNIDGYNTTRTGPSKAQIDRGLSERTPREWMKRRWFKWRDVKKGVYKDGHERPDVLRYRQESFLPRFAELEPTFVQWTFSELETKPDAGYTLVDPENLPP